MSGRAAASYVLHQNSRPTPHGPRLPHATHPLLPTRSILVNAPVMAKVGGWERQAAIAQRHVEAGWYSGGHFTLSLFAVQLLTAIASAGAFTIPSYWMIG